MEKCPVCFYILYNRIHKKKNIKYCRECDVAYSINVVDEYKNDFAVRDKIFRMADECVEKRIGNTQEAVKFINRHGIKNYRLEMHFPKVKIDIIILEKVSLIKRNKIKKDFKDHRLWGSWITLEFNKIK